MALSYKIPSIPTKLSIEFSLDIFSPFCVQNQIPGMSLGISFISCLGFEFFTDYLVSIESSTCVLWQGNVKLKSRNGKITLDGVAVEYQFG